MFLRCSEERAAREGRQETTSAFPPLFRTAVVPSFFLEEMAKSKLMKNIPKWHQKKLSILRSQGGRAQPASTARAETPSLCEFTGHWPCLCIFRDPMIRANYKLVLWTNLAKDQKGD